MAVSGVGSTAYTGGGGNHGGHRGGRGGLNGTGRWDRRTAVGTAIREESSLDGRGSSLQASLVRTAGVRGFAEGDRPGVREVLGFCLGLIDGWRGELGSGLWQYLERMGLDFADQNDSLPYWTGTVCHLLFATLQLCCQSEGAASFGADQVIESLSLLVGALMDQRSTLSQDSETRFRQAINTLSQWYATLIVGATN